jgi:acetamidase/formamidase
MLSRLHVFAPTEIPLIPLIQRHNPVRLNLHLIGVERNDNKGFDVTIAHGPDLMESSRNVVRYKVDWLVATYGVTRSQPYVLCSQAGDLKISEIVDAPNWIVSFYMPLNIFR